MIRGSRQHYERNEKILEEKKRGLTLGQIAIKHSLSRRQIKKIIRKSGEQK